MTKSLTIVKRIVGSNTNYEEMYPDVKLTNVFSVSKLAWNWKDVVTQKVASKKFKGEWNGKMLVGRVLGQLVQNEFVRDDENWYAEVPEVRYILPHKWKHDTRLKSIILLGHPDLVNFETKELIELKTSVIDNKIREYAYWQAGLYWAYFLKAYKVDLTTKVIKVAVPPREEIMTRKQKVDGANRIIQHAYNAAKMIDLTLVKK